MPNRKITKHQESFFSLFLSNHQNQPFWNQYYSLVFDNADINLISNWLLNGEYRLIVTDYFRQFSGFWSAPREGAHPEFLNDKFTIGFFRFILNEHLLLTRDLIQNGLMTYVAGQGFSIKDTREDVVENQREPSNASVQLITPAPDSNPNKISFSEFLDLAQKHKPDLYNKYCSMISELYVPAKLREWLFTDKLASEFTINYFQQYSQLWGTNENGERVFLPPVTNRNLIETDPEKIILKLITNHRQIMLKKLEPAANTSAGINLDKAQVLTPDNFFERDKKRRKVWRANLTAGNSASFYSSQSGSVTSTTTAAERAKRK